MRWRPVLGDGGHQHLHPLHPSAQVLHKHVINLEGVSPGDGVVVLGLGPRGAGQEWAQAGLCSARAVLTPTGP